MAGIWEEEGVDGTLRGPRMVEGENCVELHYSDYVVEGEGAVGCTTDVLHSPPQLPLGVPDAQEVVQTGEALGHCFDRILHSHHQRVQMKTGVVHLDVEEEQTVDLEIGHSKSINFFPRSQQFCSKIVYKSYFMFIKNYSLELRNRQLKNELLSIIAKCLD